MEERKRIALRELTAPGAGTEEGVVMTQGRLYLIGKKKQIVTRKKQDAALQTAEFWAECRRDGTLDTLSALVPEASCYVGACTNFGDRVYDYWVAIEGDEAVALPEGFEVLETDESEYAYFSCKGPGVQSMFERWAWIYRKWFPQGEYFHGSSPELEIYPYGDMEAADYTSELRVPVKKIPKDYYRRKRFPIKTMLLPFFGVLAGLIIGQRLGNSLIGMLAGLIGGLVAGTILQQADSKKDGGQDEGKE